MNLLIKNTYPAPPHISKLFYLQSAILKNIDKNNFTCQSTSPWEHMQSKGQPERIKRKLSSYFVLQELTSICGNNYYRLLPSGIYQHKDMQETKKKKKQKTQTPNKKFMKDFFHTSWMFSKDNYSQQANINQHKKLN